MVAKTSQRAIVAQGSGWAKLVDDRPIPKLRDGYMLVKTKAVALNPTDWKHIKSLVAEAGPVVGCDYAGVVEEVGPKVTKGFKPGDRVCGVVHGSNDVQPEDGAFAEYIVVKADVQIKVPAAMDINEAATLGVGITTVGQGLYQTLGLALPTAPIHKPVHVLIYGGSTATGTLGIQFAKLSGYTVVTTCSSHNMDQVKALGADAAFDYNDADCANKIRAYTGDKLTLAWDTISVPASAQICADSLASSEPGLKYASLLPGKFPRSGVEVSSTLAYTALGEDFKFGNLQMAAKPEDLKFAARFWDITRELLEKKKLNVRPPHVEPGLDKVLDGLKALEENKEPPITVPRSREKWRDNYAAMRLHAMGALPWPLQVFGWFAYRAVERGIYGKGPGRLEDDEVLELKTEVWESDDALLAESKRSADGAGEPFWVLGGPEPTDAHAAVYGFVVSALVCGADVAR
ncbi:zinc-binding dehydrogenase [Hirsutella rhossiliensis]|uniref:Zinc-binding dehydrogenase domain-containing protein n=1 Tax=Hirsutella rhossiliensis TaxID=111463 RepID=A0A9P8MX74_9HYPO|nr:zinc-binding dehydrogenase domain-containing protein [Hirsutella rhossiliensis]KAH0962054.1 zinc-binding dehydrogenase domain-containing protein [Hirsutella rhossiliensis]